MSNTVKSIFGGKSRKEKAAMAAAQEANNATIRGANLAAEQRQQQSADMFSTRRASRLGRRNLTWLPLGGSRSALGRG